MTKVSGRHLERRAYVYVRQSSMAQVHNHRESRERQYNLRARAVALGWRREQVEVIDEDQGRSGASAQDRSGFQRLVSDVALGEVGAVLGLEVSRLARSCADWYRLLEVAALSATLIIDEDGVYDPNHYNDRLLLGLKGTLSEAELHFLKSRMMGGRRNKARRGAFHIRLPAGFVWDDGIRLDPDERVRDTVQLLFRTFERLGSASAVARYFEDQGQLYPRRDGHGGLQVAPTWAPLTISRTVSTLRNPIYAGAYAYDRHKDYLEDPEQPAAGGRILIVESHPGYISYAQHQRNSERLVQNRDLHNGMRNRGAPREGTSLLHGIVLCGRCGRHMQLQYRNRADFAYVCVTSQTRRCCQDINARHIEPLIERVVLETLSAEELRLAVGAMEKLAERRNELDQQWQKRLEAARYEADRAARRYHQVEPENRLVVRTLEAEWNARLEDLDRLTKEYAAVQSEPPFTLSEAQRASILALSRDLPRLWRARTTKNSQRKEIVRLLIEDVTLRLTDEPWSILVAIHWKTGTVSEHRAERVQLHPQTTNPVVVERVATLSKQRGLSDKQIAEILNAEGHRTASGKPFIAERIEHVRASRGLRRHAQETAPEAIARIAALYQHMTDAEMAATLNAEGFHPCIGESFTSRIVFHIRRRLALKKPGSRGRPRPRET